MNKRFEAIEHPSDIGIIAYGNDLKEVFENAAYGMFAMMAELSTLKPHEAYAIKVTGDDREDLLVNWLNELIFLHETKHVLFKEFLISKISDKELSGEAKGEHMTKGLDLLHRPIKAATFNGIELTDKKARVVFDV